ncbi:MAG: hypothetical protein RLZZ165_1298 [Bacteroidota bacterium]
MALLMWSGYGYSQGDGSKVKGNHIKQEKPDKAVQGIPSGSADEEASDPGAATLRDKNAENQADNDGLEGSDAARKKKKKGSGGRQDKETHPPNSADSSSKQGYVVPCSRYRRGKMEYIDKNNLFTYIRRKGKREIQWNRNRGIRDTKTRKITRNQHLDKLKTKVRVDRNGKIKDKGNKMVFGIKWTADCAYTLTFKRSVKPCRFKKGDQINCQVTRCYEDYYECECELHAIVHYASIRKHITKSEKAKNLRKEEDAIRVKEQEMRASERGGIQRTDEEVARKATQDEIFGPIKRLPSEPAPTPGRERSEGTEMVGKTRNDSKPDPAVEVEKTATPHEEEGGFNKKDSKAGLEKESVAKPLKTKKAKTHKEKKVKEKAPKEKKVKESEEKVEEPPKEENPETTDP